MNSLTKVLLEDLLEAEKKKVTAIYGGGFKPPTKGHYAVIEKAAEQDPEIDDIIIYVGSGERDGIGQGESIQIWELYKKYLPLKTRIEPSKAPVGDVLRYAKEHPEEEVLWIIGARENNPEDFADISSRTRTIGNYPNIQLRIIQTGGGVSGTAARKAIKDNNKEQFFHLIPDIEEKEQVWDIVSPVIKENIFKDLKGALKSIWSKGGKLTQDIIDGAKREGKETSKLIQLLNKMLHGDSITDDEKTFMKAQGKDLLKVLPLVAIQGIPLPIPITPLLLVLGKKFGFNILPDSHEVMPLSSLAEIVTATEIICDNCGWEWKIVDGGDDLYICHKCGHDNNPDLEEGTCGYDTDVATGKKLDTPGGLEEGRPKKKDPKKGTGKKPEGSGRRLYTDEDPKDTVRIKFKTKEDIVNTLNKKQFKAKSHARQSQVINLIHQRVRAAYGKAKDPEVRSRLKRALDYIESRKESSKKKTERLNKLKEILNEGRYDKISNTISSAIFKYWKQDIDNGAKASRFEESFPFEDEEISIDANISVVSGLGKLNVDGGANPEEDYIEVRFEIDPKKLPEFWEEISMNLKDVIRHEIEHLTHGDGFTSNPAKTMDDDMFIRQMIDMEMLPKADYFKLEKEIDANLQGMYFRAKKEKRPFGDVINTYLDAQDITPEQKEEILNLWKRRLPVLNLPNLNEGDTYEKMAAKGKQSGNLKQGTVRARLNIPKDEKVPMSKINKEISRFKKMDQDDDKKGVQLGDKNQKYYKALQLAKTLKSTTNINENDPFGLNEIARTLGEEVGRNLNKGRNLQDVFVSLSKYMIDNGMNIKPLPKIKVIKDDKQNASDLLGKTAYYNPTEKSITLYTMDRHPKDILRSFAHEMVHHEQNLNGKLNNINTTNTNEDGDLPEIEREAYEKGNMMLRNWEDSIKNV